MQRKEHLERVLFKWKQFDGYDFLSRQGKYRSAIRLSGEDFDNAEAKKTSKPQTSFVVDSKYYSAII